MFPSLVRSPDVEQTRQLFLVYKEKIPPLMLMDPYLCNQDVLQKVTDALRENDSLTLMHLAISFDLRSVVSLEEVVK